VRTVQPGRSHHGSDRSLQPSRRARHPARLPLALIAATLLLIPACGREDPRAATPPETTEDTTAPTSTTPTTPQPTTTRGPTFAELVAEADLVLGPLELDEGRRFAVLGFEGEAGPLGDGSIELLVETTAHGWEAEHKITRDGTPAAITAPADLDEDGLDEVQVDWVADPNTDFGLLYRVDAEQLELVEIPFIRAGLHEPMNDYSIVSVEPGFVTTSVESCEPDCATGNTYLVTWRYDETEDRLVVHSQPEAEPVTPPADPLRIPPGVIEDGTHYGYLVSSAEGSFSFDRADVRADGSWSNVNPKLRTLPYAGSIPWSSGTAIEVVVQNQHVTSVAAIAPPAPADPLRIPPGVIEDGVHYGYLVSSQPGSFVFDRVDVLPNGEWQNVNPKTRTLPFPDSLPLPSGTPIQVVVQNQHVVQLMAL
jgi:hypothetical protein